MKVGDYIRTEDGLIGKIVSEQYEYKDSIGCDIDFGNNDIYNEYEMYQSIIKSSPNIIDLIEIGDYVNGYRVIDFDYSVANTRIRIWVDTENEINYIFKNDIKSIVTKEQFEAIKYEIK